METRKGVQHPLGPARRKLEHHAASEPAVAFRLAALACRAKEIAIAVGTLPLPGRA